MSEYADEICASCGISLFQCARGESSLYNPTQPKYLLCEPCFFAEDDMILVTGKNNHPQELQRYQQVLRNAE